MKNLLSGTSVLLYILFGIIVFSFLYYAFAYVPDREKRLNEKGIRTLLNIEAGIDKKADDLSSFMAQRYVADTVSKNMRDSLNMHLYKKLFVLRSDGSTFPIDSIDLKTSKNSTNVHLAKKDTSATGRKDSLTFIGQIDIVDFMKGITTNEVFQCVTLIQGNRIIYSDNPKILQAHAMSGFYKPPADSIGITIEKVVVNNKAYFQFTNRVHLGPTPVYVAGLISVEAYKRYTDEIPFLAIFFLVLLATLTFTIFPLVKIFVISKWERLLSGDYVYAGIGLLFSLYLLGTGIYAIHQWSILQKETNEKLKKWNELIQSNFEIELDELIQILESPDSLWSSPKEIIYHEIFSFNDSIKPQNKPGFKKLQLPFEERLVDDSRLAFYNGHSRIDEREYIRRIKDTTFAYQLNTTKFYIESVFSFSRAAREAVISTRRGSRDDVRAMSTDLKTLMLYQPPRGYDYCMIDRTGQVVFSSRDSHNNLNNVFESFTDAGFMHQSILSGTPDHGHFNYGRSGFQGYISPMYDITMRDDSAPLFLLTYHDESLNEWKTLASAIHAAGMMFVLICLVFFMRILLGIVHFFRKSSADFVQKRKFMTYLFPNVDSSIDYIFISFTALILMSSAIFSTSGQTACHSIVIWMICIFVYLILQYFFLTNPGWWVRKFNVKFRDQGSKVFMFNYCVFVITWFGLVLLAPASVFFSNSRGAVESSYVAMVHNEIQEKNRHKTKKLHDLYSGYTQVSSSAKTFSEKTSSSHFNNLQSGIDLQTLLISSDRIYPDGSASPYLLKYAFEFLNPGFDINPRPLERYHIERNLNGSIILFIILSIGFIVFIILKMFNNVPKIFHEKAGEVHAKLKSFEKEFAQKPYRVILVGVPMSKRSAIIKTMLKSQSNTKKFIPQTIDLLSINTPEEIHHIFEEMKTANVLLIKNWMPQGIEIPDNDRFVILRDIIYNAQSANKHIFLYASQSISSLENYLTDVIETNKNIAPQINNVREVMIRFMHQFQQITIPIHKNIFTLNEDSDQNENISAVYAKKQFFAPKYNSIWNSLSLPERFMLYDLAEDELLNLTDKVTLGMLCLKGLVVFDPKHMRMRCFDKGFALFIEQGISNKDLMLMEKNAKEKGRWRGVRLGLLLIALALVGFVYVVNPNIIQGLIGVVGAITALSASLGKISGNFKIPNLSGLFGKNNTSAQS